MPIDRTTFASGEPEESVESKIVELLCANPNTAYNAREIAVEVMDVGLSERNVERPSDVQTFMAEFLDVATIATILDRLVATGRVERRIVDTGEGMRSYYRAPSSVDGYEEA